MSALGDRIREIIPTIVPGVLTGAVQAALARAVDELDDNRDVERRRLAGLAMQGLAANEPYGRGSYGEHWDRGLAKEAVELADALLAELAKEPQP